MLVRSNRELGQTTLMITHNPEAAAIAGRILSMRDGEIVREERGTACFPPQFDPVSAARYTRSCVARVPQLTQGGSFTRKVASFQ